MGLIKNLLRQRKLTKMSIDLQRQTDLLTKKDIGSWRVAWQNAINVNNPNRNRLYDIYTDTIVDNHVEGCINQRKSCVINKEFGLFDNKNNISEKTKIINQKWFFDFISFALDSIFFGYSLIELGNVIVKDNYYTLDKVSLIPRKHVKQEFGVVVKNINDSVENGIDYTTGKYSKYLIGVGNEYNLGLLLNVSKEAISKRNILSFWDGYSEIFGLPIRIAKTTSRDENERSKLLQMLGNMGSAFYGVFPEGTELDIINSGQSDAFNVFDKRIVRADTEISKCILGQTMTIDSGSSYSQSEVHLEVFKNIIKKDERFIKYVVNDCLLPKLIELGLNLEGLTFDFIETDTKDNNLELEKMLLDNGYKIPKEYFENKYNIPIKDIEL